MSTATDRIKEATTIRAVVRRDPSDVVVTVIVWIMATTASIAVLYPVLNVIALSLSDYISSIQNPSRILPGGLNFRAYEFLLFESEASVLFNSVTVTVLMVGVGTVLSMIVTIMLSFTISRRYVPGVRFISRIVVLSGVFTPTFIAVFLVLRWLQLYNTFWALVVPLLMNMYHIIILKSFFQQVPSSLEDSAVVDGAGYTRILFQIFLPISRPAITTILLFTMVTYWNSFLPAVLYTRDKDLWTIQLLLREIVLAANAELMTEGNFDIEEVNFTERVRYAMVLLTMLPIMILYPFLQRHFTHGIMLGSLKG